MSDEEVKVKITGTSSGAQDAMKTAAGAVRDGVDQMKGALGGLQGAFGTIMEHIGAIGAVFAGGKLFGEAIEETKRFTAESIALGISLGISTTQASAYAVAIDDVGGSTEDFGRATQGLTRQLKTHESALNSIGIATRDANGHLRDMNDILLDAITVVNSYKEGTDRNLAAQTAFGRGAQSNTAIFRLTKEGMEEARKSAEELGLVVGQQNVEDFQANRQAMNEQIDVVKGMGKAVGDVLMPILTKLAQFFREIGPGAILVIKGAFGGFAAAIWIVIAACEGLWDILKGLVDIVYIFAGRIANFLSMIAHGDFKGAAAAFDGMGHEMAERLKATWNEMGADAKEARDKMWNIFAEQPPTAAPAAGKDFIAPPSKEAKGPDLRFKEWQQSLDDMKQAGDDFRRGDIAADMDYWQEKLALVRGSTSQDKELRLKIQHEISALQQQTRSQERQLGLEAVNEKKAIALAEIAQRREDLRREVELGNVSKADELAAERVFEDQKYNIERQAVEARIKLLQVDKVARQKAMDELDQLERQHALAQKKINNDLILNQRKSWLDFFHGISSGFKQVLTGFLQGTRTLGQTIRGFFDSIIASVAGVLAEIAAKWLAMHIANILGLKMEGASAIAAHSAMAGAAGTASWAGAPWPVNIGAPAFGAAMAGIAASYGGLLAAAQGFDVPSGMNPVTRLHAKEMVLPASIAEPLRAIISGGGGGGLGGVSHFHVHALDGPSVDTWLRRGGAKKIGEALRDHGRLKK